MDAFDPKRINSMLNTIGVNSLKLEGLQVVLQGSIYIKTSVSTEIKTVINTIYGGLYGRMSYLPKLL